MDCLQQTAATIMPRGWAKGRWGSASSKATWTATRSVPVLPSTSQDEPQVVEQLLPTGGFHQSRLRSGNLAYAATNEVSPPLSIDGVQTLKYKISKLSSELDTLKKRQVHISTGSGSTSEVNLIHLTFLVKTQ